MLVSQFVNLEDAKESANNTPRFDLWLQVCLLRSVIFFSSEDELLLWISTNEHNDK